MPRFNLKCQIKTEEHSISRGQTQAATSSKREGWQMSSAGHGTWGRTEVYPASASKPYCLWRFHMGTASARNSCNFILEDGLSACLLQLFIYSGELRKDAVSKERMANTNMKLSASQVRLPLGHWLVPTVGKEGKYIWHRINVNRGNNT